jgi:outer membrane protein OmpA-like peptidoglycan-associated protein
VNGKKYNPSDVAGKDKFDTSPTPAKEGDPIAYLLHIYYDFDQAYIRDEAESELLKLQKMMNENPTYLVEIGSHTDSRGSSSYNSRLSQRRADAVVRWLTDKGIARDRLTARGYGETVNVNNCKNNVPCSEQEHQMNRRTEFRIVGCVGESNVKLSQPNENPRVDACKGCPF